MKVTVADADSKEAMIAIHRKDVKIKVNRHWEDNVKQEVVSRLTTAAEEVVGRNLKCALKGQYSPGGSELVLTANNKKTVSVHV